MYNLEYVDDPLLLCTKYAASINCNEKRKLEIQVIERAVIIPNSGSSILSENDFIKLNHPISITDKPDYEKEPVIFIGNWYNVWGHLLTDTLSKLWILESNLYNETSLCNFDLVYCIDNNPFPKQFDELLDLIGMDKSKLRRIDKPTLFNKIYVPEDSIHVNSDKIVAETNADKKEGLYLYCDEYKLIIDKLKCSVQSNTNSEKIYFSVGKTKKIFGSAVIERILRKSGFQIINPSSLSFKEQLSILKGCKVFCTIEGSISFNALFLNSGSEVVLIRKLSYINSYQFMINQISNLKVTYIDMHLSVLCDKKFPYLGPFFLYPNENFVKYLSSLGYNFKVDFSFIKFLNYIISTFRSQSDRKYFLKEVCWDANVYYFILLEKYFKENNLIRKILRLFPR